MGPSGGVLIGIGDESAAVAFCLRREHLTTTPLFVVFVTSRTASSNTYILTHAVRLKISGSF